MDLVASGLAHPRRRVDRVPVEAVEPPVQSDDHTSCRPARHTHLEPEAAAAAPQLVAQRDLLQLTGEQQHLGSILFTALLGLRVERIRGPGARHDVPLADVLVFEHAASLHRIVQLGEERVQAVEEELGAGCPQVLLGLERTEHDYAFIYIHTDLIIG